MFVKNIVNMKKAKMDKSYLLADLINYPLYISSQITQQARTIKSGCVSFWGM